MTSIRSYCAVFSAIVLACGMSTQAAERQQLHGHVPAAVAQMGLRPVGRLPSTEQLNLAIGLPLRNQELLGQMLQQIYDPASPQYHQYLTPQQFTDEFGPTEEDYQAVLDFARANHLTVTATYPNRVLVDVRGSVADIEKALHVTMQVYNHPTEGRRFYAPDIEPSADLAVTLLHVGGLNNYAIPHPQFVRKRAAVVPQAAPRDGSGPENDYAGYDFRDAYVPGTILTGAGQSVGLLEFDGYTPDDITYYETYAVLPNVTLTNVLIDGYNGAPSGNGGEVEVSLDIEMALAMAPGLSKIIVYEAPNPSPWEDLMQRMANDDLAKQLSCSWGGGDPDPTAEQALIQMALQGQTFFNAVGDSDAFIGPIDFPSDSTNVVQVGGTTLTTTGPLGSYVSETVWNWDVEIDPIFYDGVGSSGGSSTYYPIPPWQQGVSMANNQGNTTMRNVPDVALTADNVYVRADEADQDGVGGTSCAAPLWAGFTALVNQQSLAGVHTTVGFLNPALYAIGKGANYGSCFHDITTGNNEWSESPSQFSAVPGYDLCTGWGTPNGTNMINTLAPAIYAPLIVPESAALVAEGCVPTNGVIDPGETVTVNFGLQNVGTKTVPNVVATLLATGGITSPSGSQNYGTVIFGGPAVSEPFTFTANGTCGEAIKATLQIQTNGALYGTATYVLNLGATSAIFTENFDEVTAPALPAGWTTTAGGAESNWVTSTTTVDTPPNAAFSPDVAAVGSNALVSPVISITSSNAQLTFRNYYNLEAGFDGGVLDIKIGNGPFQDILAAGGWFATGPYNSAISTCCGNPLGGRQAWSGYSGGYITTTVNLPAVAAGQNIQLRWMCGTDSSGGSVGWYIDTIAINQTACCGSLTPFQLWQIQYFGSTTNPKAAPGYDADGTGQNNEFKYVAGLNPTSPASVFVVDMASVTNLPGQEKLVFSPLALGRTYTPQFSTNLVGGAWSPLTTYTGPLTNGSQVSMTDTNLISPQEFFRIQISMP